MNVFSKLSIRHTKYALLWYIMIAASLIVALLSITFWYTTPKAHATGGAGGSHLDSSSFYPRVIRISHSLNANVPNGTLVATGANKIYRSDNNGVSWSQISTAGADCCDVLWEVPQNLSSLTAGTLLYAGAPNNGNTYTLTIWASTDDGYNWKQLSTGHSGPDGIWEPEFAIDSSNNLVVYYSDESHKDQKYNQLLAHQVSTDGGLTWGNEVYDVANPDTVSRPGMANVRKLSNGSYIMSYEECGDDNCKVHLKTSPDGDNWSASSSVATTASGQYFTNTPTLTILPNGTILLFGMRAWNSDGSRADGSQDLLFVNSNNGNGTWTTTSAPLHIQGTGDWCVNYSSSFLPSVDGKSLLELASDWNGSTCDMYYSTASPSSSSSSAIGAPGGKCVDVAGSNSTSGTPVQLWDCNGTSAQSWTVASNGTLQALGKCLDIVGDGTADATKVQLWDCNGVGGQQWVPQSNGSLLNPQSGRCLDDPAGNTANGTQLQIWDCNNLWPQVYQLP